MPKKVGPIVTPGVVGTTPKKLPTKRVSSKK